MIKVNRCMFFLRALCGLLFNNEKGDDPNKWFTREIMSGRWDVSDAEGPMLKAYMKEFNMG